MLYIGVNGKPKSVSSLFVGVNGVPKEVSELYGGVSNAPRRVYHKKPVETVVPSSGTMTVPAGVYKIEVFCVGGGGGGGMAGSQTDTYGDETFTIKHGGNGGGGGYTKTQTISVSPGDTINISIGAGGACEDDYFGDMISAKAGGSSSVTIGSKTVSANGGEVSRYNNVIDGVTYHSGNGGSGGGVGYYKGSGYTSSSYYYTSSKGGKDGSNGGMAYYHSYSLSEYVNAGKGQGTTTRAFGEANGTLYSQGGDGGESSYTEGVTGYKAEANTGGGGSGVNYCSNESRYHVPCDGGSGMVLLRW